MAFHPLHRFEYGRDGEREDGDEDPVLCTEAERGERALQPGDIQNQTEQDELLDNGEVEPVIRERTL